MEVDIHNYKRSHERQLELIRENRKIPERDKKLLMEFNDFMLSEGIGASKIGRYMLDLRKYSLMLGKPLKQAEEGDLRRIVGQIEQSDLAPESKRCFKIIVRKLYRFLRACRKKGEYPPEVEWISIGRSENTKKLPDELVTEEEMKNLIMACGNARDKALLAALAESGARISEIGTMRVKHIASEKYGMRLTVNGKTGARKILVVFSAPYLQQWLNMHPHNNNPESFLWVNPRNEILSYARLAAILKNAVKKAGIRKRVHPHLLRHSRATQMAAIMSEAAMKQYFGWTQGSKMAAIYVHMSGKDTDEAVLKANGIQISKEEKPSVLQPKKCLRCETVNEITNRFCKTCSLPMNEEEARKILLEDSKRARIDEIMSSLVKDPEVMEMLSRKLSTSP